MIKFWIRRVEPTSMTVRLPASALVWGEARLPGLSIALQNWLNRRRG